MSRTKNNNHNIKLRIECLLNWLSANNIKQKFKPDKEDLKKADSLKYELDIITRKKKQDNEWHKRKN